MQLAPAVVQACAQPYTANLIGASICIVLVPKASGKQRRRTHLARSATSGTMLPNRAAHLYLRRSSRHQQPPGLLNPLFRRVLLGPGIYKRRGKDSNLRGLTPTLHLGLLQYGPEQSYEGKLSDRRCCTPARPDRRLG